MLQTLLALIPTILFILIILWGFLLGLARGLRKSIILLIQAAVAFIIALVFYLIMVNLPQADKMVVDVTNTFMGQNGLQNTLQVSTTNETLTDIITELIISKVNYGEGMTLALQENANYLATLVNLAYHLVFFFISLLLYDILLFLFYLIYVLFYPERRHRRKKESKEVELNSEYKYQKRSLWGGLVGFLRGFVVAFMYMSFIGAILFMLGGGIGEKQYKEEYDFGDENKNRLYNVYEALGSYGNHGILKIMNIAKNKNEVPYYYFAANIVLSGKLVDEDLGINENIYFTEELGQYTRLVRDTFDLMMQVDSQTTIALINREIEANDDRIFTLLGSEAFRTGFSEIITKFDSGKYFINFALSMLDSIAAHLDTVDFTKDLDPNTKEILLVLLKSDHYSNYIPDDQTKKNSNQKVDTIKLSQLLVKEDINKLLNVTLELLGFPTNTTDSVKLKFYSEKLVPALKSLSIFTDETRAPQLNKALERLFVCIDNMYKPDDADNLTVEKLELLSSTTIVWTDEIKNLLDTLAAGCNLLSNVITDVGNTGGEKGIPYYVKLLFSVFHGTNKEASIASYNEIEAALKNSKIVDKVLSLSIVNKSLISALTTNFSSVYIPENINFADQGENPGELSCFLGAVRIILEDKANESLVLSLLSGEQRSLSQNISLISDLCENLKKADSTGKKASRYVADSAIMQIVLSGLIIEYQDFGEFGSIYLPDDVFVTKDGVVKNLLKNDVLAELLEYIPGLLTPVADYIDANEEDKSIDTLLQGIKEAGKEMLQNKIIEGTISNVIANLVSKTSFVKIPSYLATTEDWLSTETEPGEFRKILAAKDATNLIIQDLIDNGYENSIDSILTSLNEEIKGTSQTKLEKLCDSGIIYATLSNAIDTLLTDDLVSPNAKLAAKVIDRGERRYSLEELSALVDVINVLDLDVKSIDLSSIVDNISKLNDLEPGKDETKLDIIYKSILARSLMYVKLNSVINSTDLLVDTPLAKDTINTNVTIYKKSEIVAIISTLSKLGTDIKIDDIKVEDIIYCDTVENLCKSEIIYATMTNTLDKYLTTDIVDKNAKTASKIEYHGESRYSIDELTALVDVVKEFDLNINAIDFTSLTNNISDLNTIEAGKTESKLDILYKSIMARSILYVKLNGIITSSTVLVDTVEAKDVINTNVDIYKKAEVKSLVDVMSKLGEGVTVNNITVDNITLSDDVITGVGESSILTATISKNIIDKDVLTILSDDYDNTYNHIKNTSLTALLQSVKDGLGVTNVNTFSESSIKLPQNDKIDTLLQSDIMRATVSNKISSNIGDVYVSAAQAEKKQTYTNLDTVLVSKVELKAFIDGVGTLSDDGDYNITINNEKLKSLSTTELNKALDSSILHCIISNYIISIAVGGVTPAEMESMEVYVVSTTNLDTIDVVTTPAIKARVDSL